jgi:hypothetical protein
MESIQEQFSKWIRLTDEYCENKKNKQCFPKVIEYLGLWNTVVHKILPLSTFENSNRLRQIIIDILIDLKNQLTIVCPFVQEQDAETLNDLLQELYICPNPENVVELLQFLNCFVEKAAAIDLESTLPPLIPTTETEHQTTNKDSLDSFYRSTFLTYLSLFWDDEADRGKGK